MQAGERIVIARAGRPAAVLIPYDADTAPRTLGGSWEGRVWMSDDFDELPEELRRAFAGEGLVNSASGVFPGTGTRSVATSQAARAAGNERPGSAIRHGSIGSHSTPVVFRESRG